VALNGKQYDVALSASQAADGIKSDFNTLSIEAESYDGMGSYAKAIEFYQKAADDPTDFNFDKPYYQSRIEELKKVING
jgi:tetratricopeptide (TPR) repeat protein